MCAGVRTITGLTEDTVRIPRQTAMMSAAYAAMDTDLQASDDPAFSNVDLKPRLVGSVTELALSAVLAQHPRIGTDYIGNELGHQCRIGDVFQRDRTGFIYLCNIFDEISKLVDSKHPEASVRGVEHTIPAFP